MSPKTQASHCSVNNSWYGTAQRIHQAQTTPIENTFRASHHLTVDSGLLASQSARPDWVVAHEHRYSRARIHESAITYDGHISRPGITVLDPGPSENSYSRARKRSVIVVLEVGGFHTGYLVTKRCTAHGRRVICPARQSSGE